MLFNRAIISARQFCGQDEIVIAMRVLTRLARKCTQSDAFAQLGAGLLTPPLYGPQVSQRGRKMPRRETCGRTHVRGRETRAQLSERTNVPSQRLRSERRRHPREQEPA